jgi:hypothetical protein
LLLATIMALSLLNYFVFDVRVGSNRDGVSAAELNRQTFASPRVQIAFF